MKPGGDGRLQIFRAQADGTGFKPAPPMPFSERTLPLAWPATRERTAEKRMQAWDNGHDNLWRIPRAPWLSLASAASSCRS